jgi:hypothetical protein
MASSGGMKKKRKGRKKKSETVRTKRKKVKEGQPYPKLTWPVLPPHFWSRKRRRKYITGVFFLSRN